jgi:cobalt-zinc-cadmium efflux system protein
VAAILLRSAYFSFENPKPVKAVAMLWLAGMGLVGNAVSSLLVFSAGKSNINARAIFLHLASDVLSSAAAIAAGLIILKTGWAYADAAATVVICLIILGASLWLVKDAVHILLEGAPSRLDLEEVRAALQSIEGVREVHDLHLWSLTSGSESMSGHLVVKRGLNHETVLDSGRRMLEEKFGLTHVTLQIESEKD